VLSPQRRPATFETLNFDIYPWLWVGAAVILTAASLIVSGARMQDDPVPVTRVGDSVPSVADRYVELRLGVEATLPALRLTNDPAEILGREAAIGTDVRAARPHAMQGEVSTPAVTENVRAVVMADLTRRSASDRANFMDDVPPMDLKKAVKSAAAELTCLSPIVRQAVRDVVAKTGGEDLDPEEVQDSIQAAVKEAVRERVQEIMNEAADS